MPLKLKLEMKKSGRHLQTHLRIIIPSTHQWGDDPISFFVGPLSRSHHLCSVLHTHTLSLFPSLHNLCIFLAVFETLCSDFVLTTPPRSCELVLFHCCLGANLAHNHALGHVQGDVPAQRKVSHGLERRSRRADSSVRVDAVGTGECEDDWSNWCVRSYRKRQSDVRVVVGVDRTNEL